LFEVERGGKALAVLEYLVLCILQILVFLCLALVPRGREVKKNSITTPSVHSCLPLTFIQCLEKSLALKICQIDHPIGSGLEEVFQEWSGHNQKGVSGENFEKKCCLLAHFRVVLRANQQDL
jgi:hypothetical protein